MDISQRALHWIALEKSGTGTLSIQTANRIAHDIQGIKGRGVDLCLQFQRYFCPCAGDFPDGLYCCEDPSASRAQGRVAIGDEFLRRCLLTQYLSTERRYLRDQSFHCTLQGHAQNAEGHRRPASGK